jgi:hypothetical protein
MDVNRPWGEGRQRPRSVLERGRGGNRDVYRSACITWKNRLFQALRAEFPGVEATPSYRRSLRERKKLNIKALAATAFALRFRVLELKRLVKPLFDEIHERAVDQRQA